MLFKLSFSFVDLRCFFLVGPFSTSESESESGISDSSQRQPSASECHLRRS